MGSTIGKLFGTTKEARILLAGLDAAGKTTILYRLKLGQLVTTIPTIGFNVETIKWKNITFTAWDVGLRDKGRPLLRHYFADTSALIYVVDSNDHERMSEVKYELHSVLQEDELRNTIVLVLANKQDLANAKSPMAVSEALELHKIRQMWRIIPAIATTGEGLNDGLEWIAQTLTRDDPNGGDWTQRAPLATHDSYPTTNAGDTSEGYLTKVWQHFWPLFLPLDESTETSRSGVI